MDDNMASIREEARKRGGDELVAKVDAAHANEASLVKELDERLEKAMALTGDEERTLAVVAMAEALSTAYAKTALAHGKLSNVSDTQIMVLAVRSIANSLQVAVADRDVEASGVLDLIKNAMKGAK